LAEYPPHTRHDVYYDPSDPRDSVLAPGVDGCDLLLLLEATPFNVATVAVWSAFLRYRRKNRPSAEAGGIKIFRHDHQIHIRLSEMSALEDGLYGLGVAAAMAASTIILVWGFDESMRLMGAVWAVALVLAAAAGIWKYVNINSGRFDLRLDLAAKTLTLPQTAGRSGPLTIPRGNLMGVTVQRRASSIPSGHHYSYLPALALAAPEPQRRIAALVTWGWSEGRALAFGEWLSHQLEAEFQGIQDEEISVANETRVPA
jgi:hypothetical protein